MPSLQPAWVGQARPVYPVRFPLHAHGPGCGRQATTNSLWPAVSLRPVLTFPNRARPGLRKSPIFVIAGNVAAVNMN